MIRVLHTADLHLGRAFTSWGAPAAERHQADLRHTLTRIGELAIERAVHVVLIAGDLFDVHNPAPELVTLVQTWLGNLARHRIPVAIIPGNHDSYWYQRSVYRMTTFPDNTHIFIEPTCREPLRLRLGDDDLTIYGIAHDHTHERRPLQSLQRRDWPGFHIGMLHATIDANPGLPATERYLPLSHAELGATGLDYIALGHIHRSHVYNEGRAGHAAQPGSPEPLAIDEFGPRSVNLLSLDDRSSRIERIPIGERQAQRLEIDCTGLDQSAIIEEIRHSASERLIADIVLSGTPDEIIGVDAIKAAVAPSFFHVTIRDRTEVVNAAFARAIEHEQTIRGYFVRTLRARAAAATPDERATIELALKRGLIALHRRSVS
ncbi:MAG TPA: DNA repair exonuclease [Nitrolancea sp.]|nr:DNA repair exonuclease [Nitrolancea sp.]